MAKNNQRVVLVAGATGHQGGAALQHLRQHGFPVRALTRDPDKPEARRLVGQGTEVVRGDLDDEASLSRAMDGVYGFYLVQRSIRDNPDEAGQGVRAVDVARRSRVSHLVYSSVVAADRQTGIAHFESKGRIEQHIQTAGLRYTILRPVFFMENWLGMRDRIEQGTLALPLGPETRLQMIAVEDIGEFVAMAFEKPGHWQGRAFELAGDELPMTTLAERFSRITGRDVPYEQVPWTEWERQAGPEMTRMWRLYEDPGTNVDIGAVRQEYPGLTSFERWLQSRWTRARTA